MVPPTRSRRRALLALAAAALVIAIGWAAWSTLASRPAVESAAPGFPSSSDTAASDRSSASENTLARDTSPRDLEVPAGAPSSTSDTVARSAVGGEDPSLLTVDVLVREKASGAPVPDAEVFFFASENAMETQLMMLMDERGFGLELLRRTADKSRTGADGRARLRCRPGELALVAASASMWGGQTFTVGASQTEPLAIDVQPMAFVHAQVVDETGHPLSGIPVWMRKKVPGFLSFRFGAFTSGREGLAELGPLDTDTEERELWLVGIEGALPGKAIAQLDIREPPKDPIQLVLPAHGSLEVRISCPDGKPFAGPAEMELSWMSEDEECAQTVHVSVSPGSGAGLYERVGIDLGVKVVANIPGISHTFEASGWGPRHAGEKAVLSIKLERALSVLVGRVVDDHDEPVRNREIALAGLVQSTLPSSFEDDDASTDAGGNFALAVDCGDTAGEAGSLLLRTKSGEPELGGVVGMQVSAGRNDLGRIVLAPARTIATGVVVDENNAPVSQASVVLMMPGKESSDTALGWALAVQSDAQGRFDLRGWAGDGLVRLRANHQRRARGGSIEVPLGSQGVRLPITAPRIAK
jgi:hypothetical protein